ncbi:similar to Saccharomyces cerevisiae YKL170W MRPL38 Mitochondrial ribosomal protein of the large subunit [Maudiozyma barnettii]|uniref:Large ribosomal subunit protein uL14m n=1 Tax=Maudiozyma barnettii TaxID=61262 RepID=A0A8H2VFM2_9SACH|nr:mitochondrial 54S ribosomal protein YmL38/YmL34 [Kazachstania barnettii]CAB4254625.1 similar to Saccharomyces cerevisiae YKL170W MRPL38 Mitochondrial ribosomal protein of the large subunit [Kazachstania barnettii]CAD1782667.1 similar to Saccharomyces cerevisiae YKL170W MRPL38 Mitochondrial ribosomal protein of the large subunit [Kazachstania barnettii]
MIYLKSMLKVIDNSGAQLAECIKVIRKGSPKSPGTIGDRIVCVIQKSKPLNQAITGTVNTNRVKKGDIVHAIIVRTKQSNIYRSNGFNVHFDDNACVLINKNTGEPLGTRIMVNDGVVGRELMDKGYNKICSLASKIV